MPVGNFPFSILAVEHSGLQFHVGDIRSYHRVAIGIPESVNAMPHLGIRVFLAGLQGLGNGLQLGFHNGGLIVGQLRSRRGINKNRKNQRQPANNPPNVAVVCRGGVSSQNGFQNEFAHWLTK